MANQKDILNLSYTAPIHIPCPLKAAIWPESYVERQNLYAAFKRLWIQSEILTYNWFPILSQFCACVAREIKSEADTVSEEVVALWHRAVKANCRSAKTELFKKWLESGKDFARLLPSNLCTTYSVCLLKSKICVLLLQAAHEARAHQGGYHQGKAQDG